MMRQFFVFLIAVYRMFVSPVFVFLGGRGCMHNPTCSEYTQKAILDFGVVHGLYLGIRRFSTCSSAFY